MKALVFRHNLAREAVSAIGGHVDRHAFVSRLAPVRLEDVNELPLPAQDWVRVETTFSGLCGSDVKQILLNGSRDNPLTALVSFPHVLGHEVVGRARSCSRRLLTGRPSSFVARARSRSRSSRCSATCIPAPRCGRRRDYEQLEGLAVGTGQKLVYGPGGVISSALWIFRLTMLLATSESLRLWSRA